MACGPAGEVLATTYVSMGYSVMMVDCGRDTSTFGYVYGPDWGNTSRSAATIGGSLAMYCSTGAPSPVFFAFDANGNVTDLVATDGNLAAHYEFDPYGNPLVSSGDLAVANPYRFSSKYTSEAKWRHWMRGSIEGQDRHRCAQVGKALRFTFAAEGLP